MSGKQTKLKDESPIKSVFSTLGTELVLFPVLIIVGALITRYLGPTNKGIYSFIILIYGIFVPLMMFGNSGSTRYYLSNKEYEVKDIFGSLLVMVLYFSIATDITIYSLWYLGWLGKTGAAITHPQILLVLVSIPLTVANLLLMRVFIGTSQFVLKNKIFIAFRLVQSGLILFFAYGLHADLTGIIIATTLGTFIYFLIQLKTIIGHYNIELKYNKAFVKKAHTYGIKLWLNEVIRVSNSRLDQFVVGILLAPKLLGFFAVSVVVAELIQKLPNSVVQVFFNEIAKADTVRKKELVERIHKLTFWVTLLGAAFLVITGYWLIVLMYGRAFDFSYTILLYYLPGVVIYMSTRIFLQYFAASGQPMKNTWIQLSGILVGIPAYFLLIGRMGVVGAAIGSTLAYFMTNVTALYLYHAETGSLSLDMYLMNKEDWDWVGEKYREVKKKLIR